MKIPALVCALICFFAANESTTATDQAPTFHSIKLGVPLGSLFQRCPTKDGDYPQFRSSPYKDLNGNTIPCFFEMFPPKTEPYPEVKPVRLVENIAFFWDEKRNPVPPMPGSPEVWLDVFVPASKEIGDGTVEAIRLTYDSSDSDRVKTALSEKYGTSHPPAEKINPKIIEMVGAKLISQEVWKTADHLAARFRR